MRKYFLISFIALTAGYRLTGIYDYSFTAIEGNTVALNSYQQKRIILVVLPVVENADNNRHLARLDSISRARSAGVVMIGVPSIEEGYSASNAVALKNWYRSRLGAQFIIAAGMYTRKTSGSNQHSIFKWLTDKNLNGHFNDDTESAGSQFFISPSGELYGVAGPEARFSNNVFNRLIQ